MKKVFCSLLCLCLAFGNDFTKFYDESDDDIGFGKTPSISTLQTNVEISRNQVVKTKSATQIELARAANIARNGKYIMLVASMIPTLRIADNVNMPLSGYSFGGGIRGGMISYIDGYIGIRGYLSLDINNDKLSPIKKQRDYHSGTFVLLGAGIDIMIDFFIDKSYKNTVGFFVGVGAGALIYFDTSNPIMIPNQDSTKYVFGGNLTVQAGLSSVFAYRHRIEAGIRFLPTQSLVVQEDGVQADFNFYVGYSYKFGR